MNKNYYVNKQAQPNGDHEVHEQTCSWLPSAANRLYLGEYPSCFAAVSEAKRYYTRVNGCKHCSKPCHSQ